MMGKAIKGGILVGTAVASGAGIVVGIAAGGAAVLTFIGVKAIYKKYMF